MKRSILFFLIIFIIHIGSTAHAITINGKFSGYFCEVNSNIADFSNKISEGTKFAGNLSYDSQSPIIYSSEDYNYTIFSPENLYMDLTINGINDDYHISGFPGGGIVVADSSSDLFRLEYLMQWNGSIAGAKPSEVWLNLNDSTGGVFDDDSLPTMLNLDDFDDNGIWIVSDGDPYQYYEIFAKFDCLEAGPAPVPEPSTLLLFGTALASQAGLFLKKRKAKKNSIIAVPIFMK